MELNLFIAVYFQVTYFACTVPNCKLVWNSMDTYPCNHDNKMLCWEMCAKLCSRLINILESNKNRVEDVFVWIWQNCKMWNQCRYTQYAYVKSFGWYTLCFFCLWLYQCWDPSWSLLNHSPKLFQLARVYQKVSQNALMSYLHHKKRKEGLKRDSAMF